jgi:tetratricopeptide (TPR) repeat protein
MRLDPFFNSAILEGGMVLAFNHQRFNAALDLLKEGLDWDPLYHEYRLYMAVVLYKSHGKDEKLVDLLSQAVQFPDCPVLLERVLANLFIKYGRAEQAAQMFRHIIETAPKETDREEARNRLQRL